MNAMYFGTVGELKSIRASGNFEKFLVDCFVSEFGKPSEALVNSWLNSTGYMLDLMSDPEFDALPAILELQIPIGAERLDLVLLGGTKSKPKALIIELKQWSSVKQVPGQQLLVVPREGRAQHPSEQALNYRGKMMMFSSLGEAYEWRAIAVAHNLGMKYQPVAESAEFTDFTREARLFYTEERKELREYLFSELLPCDLGAAELQSFTKGGFAHTGFFFDFFRRHAKDIRNNIQKALYDKGMGLTQVQRLIVEDILEKVASGEEACFLVEGRPGTGKTLLAAQLLLKTIGANKSSVMSFRNNRLMAILRKCFNNAGPGAANALLFSSVPMNQTGLADDKYYHDNQFDFVVCDEAQRFSAKNIEVIMKRAPVTVFFHDENQLLNPPEQGDTATFEKVAAQVGKNLIRLNLGSPVRCRGGKVYQDWVDSFVEHSQARAPKMNNYRLEVFSSINDMISELRILAMKHRVALVACFTESKGKKGSVDDPDNLRIGHPLSSGLDIYKNSGLNIPWLMDPQKDYTPYWLGGESNNLDRIASIYGCQGFESDYVEVVWGRDFIRRGDTWKVGHPDIITDNIDKLQVYVRSNGDKALIYFQNRYRIFLTRGMLGTFIFCEDPETSEYLETAIIRGK